MLFKKTGFKIAYIFLDKVKEPIIYIEFRAFLGFFQKNICTNFDIIFIINLYQNT